MNYKFYRNESLKIIGIRANEMKQILRITWKNIYEMLNAKLEKIESSYEESNHIELMKEMNEISNDKFIDKFKEIRMNEIKIKKENKKDEVL